MKKLAAIAVLFLCGAGIAQADSYYHGQPGTTYNNVGGNTIGSDGTSYRNIGNHTYGSDGSSSNRLGSTTIHSNGTSSTQVGNTMLNSNGTTVHRIGNTTIGSDGTTCTRVGNSTICNWYSSIVINGAAEFIFNNASALPYLIGLIRQAMSAKWF